MMYEQVHPTSSWNDFKRRLDVDRRCFIFSHRLLPGEPLVILHTALGDHLRANMQVQSFYNFIFDLITSLSSKRRVIKLLNSKVQLLYYVCLYIRSFYSYLLQISVEKHPTLLLPVVVENFKDYFVGGRWKFVGLLCLL